MHFFKKEKKIFEDVLNLHVLYEQSRQVSVHQIRRKVEAQRDAS